MYYSAFGLLAVIILLIQNQDVLFKRDSSIEIPSWQAYRHFLFAALFYYATDILWGILESLKLPGLLFADTLVYFIAMAIGLLFWTKYVVTYLNEDNSFSRFLLYFGRIFAAAVVVLALANAFTPTIFLVDDQAVYYSMPARHVILILQIALLLLLSVFAFHTMRSRQDSSRSRYRTMALFGVIISAFLIIQIWFPYQPLYTVSYMVGICLLHSFVVSDEKDEYRQGVEEAEEIRDKKQIMSSLFDNLPGIMFTKNVETGAYLACNQAFAEYAGKENPEEVAGLTDAQLFDPERAKNFAEDDRMALSMDEPYTFFEDIDGDDGKTRQYQTTKMKYTDYSGRLCILGVSQDVTDMVRVQRETATTKEAYEKARGTGIIYSHFAQTLARGYREMYYVNLDSEEYIEYRSEEDGGALTEVERGWHFFELCQIIAEQKVHQDDQANVIRAMDRKTLEAALDRNRSFVMTFRVVSENGPVYVTMKVSRMEDDERYIILGITDVDEEMKQRHLAERMREEQIAYARLSALTGDFLCIYIVVPETGSYREISSSAGYDSFAQAKKGADFFASVRETSREFCYPEDLSRFLSVFTKENVMEEIRRRGIFTVSYRIMMENRPVYVQLKAAMVEESEGTRLIVGVNDIDSQVRQEEEYVRNLSEARINARIDALTGVKNKHAFKEAEERLELQIAEQRSPEFAIVILDVNDLKKVNDTEGHKAGDQFLQDACRIICNTFKHSPVFRVGGDEFAVISQGNDYERIDELVQQMHNHNRKAKQTGDIIIACGMAKFENETSAAEVYERADQNMYENKSMLKARRSASGVNTAGQYGYRSPG